MFERAALYRWLFASSGERDGSHLARLIVLVVVLVAVWGSPTLLSADRAALSLSIGTVPPHHPEAANAASSEAIGQSTPLRSTTADLKQDYDVLGIVTHYQELGFGFRGDPLEGAINAGWPRFEEKARKMGADAIVGVRFEFENPNSGGKQEGRLLIYGTAVKVK